MKVNRNTLGPRSFCYNPLVTQRKKNKAEERPVFDSIRKPTAPPTQKFGGSRPDEKVRPSKRKVKHKKDPESEG
jgi:hypothetical protein